MKPASAAARAALLAAALGVCGLVGIGGAWGCAGEGADPERERPAAAGASARRSAETPVRDVLLVTVDTLRADALGFAGNARAATPALDRLAEAGRSYPRAHAHNVVTLPSHANILTGRLPFEHGVRDNSGFVLPEDVPTAATLLREAGFATAAVVGAYPLDARFGLARGFDLYDDAYPEGSSDARFRTPERRGSEVVERALAWWRDHEGERRFLWVHLFDPHAPYEPPEPFASRHAADPYLGEVAAVDAFLAPLLEAATGGGEPALVVFTADHGEALGEHGELTHGLFAYEETLLVPLVLWGPGVPPGESPEPARHVDLLPTILDAAGVPAPPGLPGRSLLGPPPEEALTTYFEALTANLDRGWAPLRGVIREGRKFVSLPLPELYDLEADPDEERNLYDAERETARRLARLLPEESVWPPDRRQASSHELAALRSLGYLAGSARAKERYTAADDPKNLVAVDQQVHRFIDLYQRGRLPEATELAREIVREQPALGLAYYHLAQVLLERGLDAEALEVLETARARGAATPAVLRQLGLLLAERGRAPEAVALLQPLVPDGVAGADPETLNALGVALSETGRQAEARRALRRVFESDPRNPEARQNLALVALRLEEWEEARREAEQAVAANRALPLAWNYLGVALYNLGRPREALDAWEEATALDPGNYDLLYNLGLVAAEQGDLARARSALARFADGAPPERYGPDIRKARALLHELERSRP
jgi:arylsulfatase A-like enzyme/thioredoxin-like negative regulator of GroEL